MSPIPRRSPRWYIDAWAVFDGYAFASLREAGSIQADVTCFVAPPYFEPEPVATLATALGATRGCFQDRLLDSNGEEMPFDSLEQVVETVRRMYRAGGVDLGGPAPAVPAPARPRPWAPGETKPAELVNVDMRRAWQKVQQAHGHDVETAWRSVIRQALSQFLTKFMGAAVVEALTTVTDDGARRGLRGQAVIGWMATASALGLDLIYDHEQHEVVSVRRGEKEGFSWPAPQPREVMGPLVEAGILARLAKNSDDAALPFSVPLPAAFQEHTRLAYAPIRNLGQVLCAASADVYYLRSIKNVEEAIPLIVLALLQVRGSTPSVGFPPLPETPEADIIVDAAARWLTRALPSDVLDGHPAEDLVHETTVRLLSRGSDEDRGAPLMIHA
jgi:hypothetical protein